MKIILEYEVEKDDYEEFLKHEFVQDEPMEFFDIILDDYITAMLTGFRIER